MIPLLGGLGAATLWAIATIASSRTSRILGAQVVIAWVMLVGTIAGIPLAIASPLEGPVEPLSIFWVLLAGICYVGGLLCGYVALKSGKVSIVAPIVATEGAIAAILSVVLGDPLSITTTILLAVIVIGVVLASMEPDRSVQAAIDDPVIARRTIAIAVLSASIFGVGLAATGRAAEVLPLPWVALTARVVGTIAIGLPVFLSGRLRATRGTMPLLIAAGLGELIGSVSYAWGAREDTAIAAVMGSQFAAIAAVAAFLLFGERLGRAQAIGVGVIVAGVTALAATAS